MPGGHYCCVYDCGNNQKHNNDKNFFSLPTDPEKLALWLSLIQREDLLEKSNSRRLTERICCDHFDEENFKYVRNLNKDAVPHLKLPIPNSPEEQKHDFSSLKQDSLNTQKLLKENSTHTKCEMTDDSSQTNEGEEETISKLSENINNSESIQTPLSLTTNKPRKKKLKIELRTVNKKIKL